MSYYSSGYDDIGTGCLTIILCIVFIFIMMCSVNSCSATTWNSGICPDCEVRYELRGASRGLKYYSCPECGQEVERY